MMKPLFFTVGLLTLGPTHQPRVSYLCIPDYTIGFQYDKATKEWSNTSFRIKERYVLARPDADKFSNYKWGVTEVGSKFPSSFCMEDFNEKGLISCNGGFVFEMSTETLRFLISKTFGYIQKYPLKLGDETLLEGSDTPYMTIGKCSAINL